MVGVGEEGYWHNDVDASMPITDPSAICSHHTQAHTHTHTHTRE